MRKAFTILLMLAASSALASATPRQVVKKLRTIDDLVLDGVLHDLNDREISKVLTHLNDVIDIMENGGQLDSQVVCAPEDSTDFAIFRKKDGVQIGADKRGNIWCSASLQSNKGGVVCAPEDSTDFAFYNVEKNFQIGGERRDNNWCLGKVNEEYGVICAPEDSTDFAIYRISDGKQLGDEERGEGWCSAVINSVKDGVVCVPVGFGDFALYDIKTARQIGSGSSGPWCTTGK